MYKVWSKWIGPICVCGRLSVKAQEASSIHQCIKNAWQIAFRREGSAKSKWMLMTVLNDSFQCMQTVPCSTTVYVCCITATCQMTEKLLCNNNGAQTVRRCYFVLYGTPECSMPCSVMCPSLLASKWYHCWSREHCKIWQHTVLQHSFNSFACWTAVHVT